jgi:hypothetical protein
VLPFGRQNFRFWKLTAMCQRRMNRQSLVRKGQRVYWVGSHVPFCGSFSLRENGRTFAGEDLGVREGQHAGSTASVCRREQEGRVREKRTFSFYLVYTGSCWGLLNGPILHPGCGCAQQSCSSTPRAFGISLCLVPYRLAAVLLLGGAFRVLSQRLRS